MLAEERHNAIISQINAEGSVRVKDLSVKFEVTEDCIRKDLTLLEKKGLLKKTYGGAMQVRVAAHEYFVEERKGKNMEAKMQIARKALELIHENDLIFLDISTTNIEVARMLVEQDIPVTVVTNCIEVMLVLNVPSKVKLIALGGEVSERQGGFVGALTNEQLKHYSFDCALIGVVGVDLDNDRVSTYIPADGTTKEEAIRCSRKAYMLLETRKFHEDGSYWYTKVNDFDGAIMEKEPSPGIVKKMKDYEIEWIF